jgi:hypothetical protein
VGLCGIPYCLTQFLHHTVWHSASEVELPLLGLGLGLGSGLEEVFVFRVRVGG